MNIKEHLQFLTMLIPTFLLLAALLFSLAAAARNLAGGAVAAEPTVPATSAVQDTEIGPVQTVVVGSK